MKIKKLLIVTSILLLAGHNSFAQVYFTKNGSISFFSKATMEDIKADNNQVISIINIQSGEIRFSVLNTAFHFPKAMMEEHFNSDYMQSDQFPSSTFKGIITNISKTDITKDGNYKIAVQGYLSIHGITKNIISPATLIVKEGKLSGNAKFKIFLKEYNIKIPSIVANNISESIDITVTCNYEKK
jgi:polyisoprenoid-binding protein YceI